MGFIIVRVGVRIVSICVRIITLLCRPVILLLVSSLLLIIVSILVICPMLIIWLCLIRLCLQWSYEHHSKTPKRVWSFNFGVRQALALVYYMYCADYNCLYYSYSAVLLLPDLLVCTMMGTFLDFSEFRTQVDHPKGPWNYGQSIMDSLPRGPGPDQYREKTNPDNQIRISKYMSKWSISYLKFFSRSKISKIFLRFLEKSRSSVY